jgi:hypothetical protein
VEDFIRNRRTAETAGKTEYELLQKFINETSEVTWHWIDSSEETVSFGLVLTTPYLTKVRHQYGAKVVGLDSVWK